MASGIVPRARLARFEAGDEALAKAPGVKRAGETRGRKASKPAAGAVRRGAGGQAGRSQPARRSDPGGGPGAGHRHPGRATGAARHRGDARPEAARDLGLRVLRQEPPPARLRQPAEGAAHGGPRVRRQLARRLRRGRHPAHAAHRDPTARRGPLPRRGRGQRPGHRAQADPAGLRQAALRLEVPHPEAAAGPAGHRRLRRRHVRPAHHRQAGHDRQPHRAGPPAHLLRGHGRHQEERAAGAARRAQRVGRQARNQGRDRAAGHLQEGPPLGRRLRRADARSPTRTPRSSTPRPGRTTIRYAAGRRTSCPTSRRRSSRIPTASSWGC